MALRMSCFFSLIGRSLLLAFLVGCGAGVSEVPSGPVSNPALPARPFAAASSSRLSMVTPSTSPLVSLGVEQATVPGAGVEAQGPFSLNFRDLDIREVAATILGGLLRENYTIDPDVQGRASFQSSAPLSRAQIISTLQALLAQNNATLLQISGLYRVMQVGGGGGRPAEVALAGVVLPLRNSSAGELAQIMQPLAVGGARVLADVSANALVIAGDAVARDALSSLAAALDVDELRGRSYAIFPVTSGSPRSLAGSLEVAVRAQTSEANAALLRFIPLDRMSAVLAVANSSQRIDEVRRIYSLLEQRRSDVARYFQFYSLQHANASRVAHLLQQTFTPGHITAQPSGANGTSGRSASLRSQVAGTLPAGGISQARPSGAAQSTTGASILSSSQTATAAQTGVSSSISGQLPPNTAGLQNVDENSEPDSMRIIPDENQNAIFVFGRRSEQEAVRAMLARIDTMPIQVRIDAVIAEVTLNDQLRYGTQFFFTSGDFVSGLGSPAQLIGGSGIPGANLAQGFVLGSRGASATAALTALQGVTKVNVLSSPQIMVISGQPARLRVGDLVPFLTQSSQNTIFPGASIINSIEYRQTGVMMDVIPRVNTSGVVALDIVQEVSEVNLAAPRTEGISSPTFSERTLSSRVVVEDGQTLALAGLIRENSSTGNRGIPWLKDIPLLGLLAGSQDNSLTRTELIIFITPRVVYDQSVANALTNDLREQLPNAARLPTASRRRRTSAEADPGASLRHDLGLERR